MRTKMFIIDDGARHTICAVDHSDAFAEYARVLHMTDGDWPSEWPTIEEVDPTKRVTIELGVNLWSHTTKTNRDGRPTLTAAEWCDLVGTRYLACSEY